VWRKRITDIAGVPPLSLQQACPQSAREGGSRMKGASCFIGCSVNIAKEGESLHGEGNDGRVSFDDDDDGVVCGKSCVRPTLQDVPFCATATPCRCCLFLVSPSTSRCSMKVPSPATLAEHNSRSRFSHEFSLEIFFR
jgi:hypothetical protein